MNSPTRTFFARLSLGRSTTMPHNLPPLIIRSRIDIERDNEDLDEGFLPPYTPREDPIVRSPSPSPTYYTIDPRDSDDEFPNNAMTPPCAGLSRREQQVLIDQLVRRIRTSLKNQKSWRLLSAGDKSFFWAIKCEPGTADFLSYHICNIKERVFGGRDWHVEKFVVLFQGQRLRDLYCRPVQGARYGTHEDPLDNDYLVIHVLKRGDL
jgi:hypothetical protein